MIWHFAICCYYFINQLFNNTISIMQTTTADSQSTHWLCGGVGWADRVAAAGQQGFPQPTGSRQSRQLWQGLHTTVPSSWFIGFLLCPGAVICPTKAMWALKALPFLWPQTLLPRLMNDSDFRPLYAFFLLTNKRLWPEETPRLLFLFCSSDVNHPPSLLLLHHCYCDLDPLPNLYFLPYEWNQADFLRLGPSGT